MKNESPTSGSITKPTLAALVILALFIYLPAFVTRFGLLNDYDFMAYRTADNWPWFPETDHLVAIGRPIGALLVDFQGLFLGSLQDFAYARLFSFMVTLGSAWLIYRYLITRFHFDPVVAGAAAFCMLMLPPSQYYILSLTNFVPGALTVFCSLLCYGLLERVEPLEFCRGNARALGWTAAAMATFYLTLSTYPPSALSFLALTFAQVLFSPMAQWPKVRLGVLRDLVFAGTGMIIYLLVSQFILLPFFFAHGTDSYREIVTSINAAGQYRFGLTSDVGDKLGVFVYLTGLAFGGAFHAIFGETAAWIMGGFTIILFTIVAFRFAGLRGSEKDWSWIGQRAGMGILIIVCSCAPSLAAKGQTGYRVVPAYEMIALFCLFAPFLWFWRMKPNFPIRGLSIALVFLLGAVGEWNISNVARYASVELLFVRQKLESAEPDKLATVIGVYRAPQGNYLEWPTLLEFATEISHIPDFAGAIKSIMRETRVGDRPLRYTYAGGLRELEDGGASAEQIAQGAPYKADKMFVPAATAAGSRRSPLLIIYPNQGMMLSDEQTLMINFNDLVVSGPSLPVQLPSIRTSNGSGGRALVDGNLPDYWQPGPPPQWMEVTFPDPTAINQFTFGAGPDADGAANMPKAWRIMASDNEINWVEVGSITGQDKWKVEEARTYNLSQVHPFKHYLLVFTAGNGPNLKLYKIRF